MADTPISPKDFGAAFTAFMEQMREERPRAEPYFPRRLREHFGADPSRFAIVTDAFGVHDHANVHAAIEAFVTAEGRSHELVGIGIDTMGMRGLGIAQLVSGRGRYSGEAPVEGPVEYRNVRLDGGRVVPCTQLGLYLVRDGDAPLAIFVHARAERFDPGVDVEVLAAERATAEACLAALRTSMRERNVYRGHIISLSVRDSGMHVDFVRLPRIERGQIILPAGVLERVERESVGFAKHAAKLVAAGRHLKRGMLLHGPPGTGKTLTAMYLAGRMPERTIVVISARGVGLLEHACTMARLLEPATVILEDVDLIAEERTQQQRGCAPLLFELLNQMDGLADDADILFVLTTNRPDLLEPALAARPGRIDQAVEIPLPDADCRRRLFALYSGSLDVTVPIEPYVARTAGASAAFVRELMRKAALFAADDGGELAIGTRHLDDALHEMVVEGGELTRSLLGGAPRAS